MSESKIRPIKSNSTKFNITQPIEIETTSSGIKLSSIKKKSWESNVDEERLERQTVSKLIGKYEQMEKLKNETLVKSPQSAEKETLKKLKEKFETQPNEKNSTKQVLNFPF